MRTKLNSCAVLKKDPVEEVQGRQITSSLDSGVQERVKQSLYELNKCGSSPFLDRLLGDDGAI